MGAIYSNLEIGGYGWAYNGFYLKHMDKKEYWDFNLNKLQQVKNESTNK